MIPSQFLTEYRYGVKMGTSDGPPDSFDITVDPTNLQPGTYSTTITIEGAGETKQVQISATKKKKLSIVAREKPVVVKR